MSDLNQYELAQLRLIEGVLERWHLGNVPDKHKKKCSARDRKLTAQKLKETRDKIKALENECKTTIPSESKQAA